MNDVERMQDRIEVLLQKLYWVIDILPEQVKKDSPGQYFKVEQFFLKDKDLRRKQLNILLKLNCYYDFRVRIDSESIENLSLDRLKELIGKVHLSIEVGDALIVLNDADTHMTIFNVEGRLLEMVNQLGAAEGMFVWQPEM